MTRIEFKFKILYDAFREAHFQTATHLSLKRRKKKEMQYLIKRNNHLFTEQKKQKKKKKKSKPLKPKSYFPIKLQITDSYSLRLQILRCSFKNTDRTCVATETLKPKSYFPIKIQTHSDYRFFTVPSNIQIGLACSTLSSRRKRKASATVKTSATMEISVRSLQQAVYKLSDLCSSTINDSKGRHFPPFFCFLFNFRFKGF